MRRGRRDTGLGFDALLDTMANVVGILVILLVVTQIDVGQAVKRIRAESGLPPRVDGALLAQTDADAARAREERVRLEEELAALGPEQAPMLAELAMYREAAAEANGRPPVDPALLRLPASELERVIGARARQLASYQAAVSDAQQTLIDLAAERARRESGGSVQVVRLPDPRPAPENSKRLEILCRFERCFLLDVDALSFDYEKARRAALGTTRSLGTLLPDEQRLLRDYFAQHSVGTQELRLRMLILRGGLAFARLDWRSELAGETTPELSREGSEFRQSLAVRPSERHHLRYYVWPDSFRTYLAARGIGAELGFEAGWLPRPADGDLFWGDWTSEGDYVD